MECRGGARTIGLVRRGGGDDHILIHREDGRVRDWITASAADHDGISIGVGGAQVSDHQACRSLAGQKFNAFEPLKTEAGADSVKVEGGCAAGTVGLIGWPAR